MKSVEQIWDEYDRIKHQINKCIKAGQDPSDLFELLMQKRKEYCEWTMTMHDRRPLEKRRKAWGEFYEGTAH